MRFEENKNWTKQERRKKLHRPTRNLYNARREPRATSADNERKSALWHSYLHTRLRTLKRSFFSPYLTNERSSSLDIAKFKRRCARARARVRLAFARLFLRKSDQSQWSIATLSSIYDISSKLLLLSTRSLDSTLIHRPISRFRLYYRQMFDIVKNRSARGIW